MSRDQVKVALAGVLLLATVFAIARFRAFDAAAPERELASQCDAVVGAIAHIANFDGTIPPAVNAFEDVGAILKTEIIDFHVRRVRVHPCAGTVFDDPSCQQFQEFEPSRWQSPWCAPGGVAPSPGGFLLAW